MILVDTSAWIAAMRHSERFEQVVLRQLIDADEAYLAMPVRMELLAGISARDRARFTRALTALPVVVPTEETWTLAESWIAPAADAGHRFAITDLLIGAMAHELGGLVWSLDGDFARLESLGYVQRYDPPT